MDTSGYLGHFLDEGAEALDALGVALDTLGRAEGDPAAVAAPFRIAHNLKGMCAAMGFAVMSGLLHRMEGVLAAVRDDGVPATDTVIDALLDARDLLALMLARVAAGDTAEVDASAAGARLDALASGVAHALAQTAAATAPARPAPPARARAARGRADGHGTIPLGEVLPGMARMVDDLAAVLGKRAELVVRGADVRLGVAVARGLRGPLVHLIRNAVDHGIETPAARAAAGKDPRGRVTLSARAGAGRVVVEVGDDGRGMDPAALRAAALRSGRIDATAAALLGDAGALELAFAPGVSTAGRVTQVSGRGVGMDAVRDAVARLGGEVAVASRPGRGSAVTIRVPSSAPGDATAQPWAPA